MTLIFFSGLIASGFLGSVTVSTPFLKLATISSVWTPSGTSKRRSKEIGYALKTSAGSLDQAARMLRISRKGLYLKRQRLGRNDTPSA